MRFTALMLLTVYWLLFFLLLTPTLAGNPLTGYTATGNFTDASGFDPASEISSGGFFTGIIGIFAAAGRLFLLAFLGIGLNIETPAWFQICFSSWQLFISIATILAILSLFWDK